jgi:hypothetical protein
VLWVPHDGGVLVVEHQACEAVLGVVAHIRSETRQACPSRTPRVEAIAFGVSDRDVESINAAGGGRMDVHPDDDGRDCVQLLRRSNAYHGGQSDAEATLSTAAGILIHGGGVLVSGVVAAEVCGSALFVGFYPQPS